MPNNSKLPLADDALSESRLTRLKWSTTIAIIGLPVLIQILGALMLLAGKNPGILSAPVMLAYGAAALIVISCGLYTVTNRVFLRYSAVNNGLKEWEAKTQKDAFAFSYRVICIGALLAFAAFSVLGALQLFHLIGWMDLAVGRTLALNIEGLAALSIILAYFILFLPTLYMAWTLKPLGDDEGVIAA